MRKLSALAMVALLALTTAFAVVGCGAKQEPAATSTETMPPSETMSESTMTDTSMMADTSMSH